MTIGTRAVGALCLTALLGGAAAAADRSQGTKPHGQTPSAQSQTRSGGNQERRTLWWRDAAVQKELDLSERQIAKIEKIWTTNLPGRRELYKKLETLEAETNRLIRENTADEKVLAKQLDQLEAVRSEINKSRMLMVYRMHQALTPEQYRKLSEIAERRRKDGGRR